MKILVVDDERAVASMMASTLEAAGYTVDVANSGEQALAIPPGSLSEVRLTVMDVAMWPMTGMQVAERLREKQPDMCVLFVSGGAGVPMLCTDHFVERCWGFLEKPFRPKQLLQAVERLLTVRGLARSA
jgi:DNA-binding NtrC family response regulator